MKHHTCLAVAISLLTLVVTSAAQISPATSTAPSAQIPHLIRFSGVLLDEAGQPMTGLLGVTFALYSEEQGGAPLWLETQNAQADNNGHYSVMLGANTRNGLPLELFTSGEARWLEIRSAGLSSKSRVLLVSVPYAIKAHEAETLAGRSISDFVLNEPNSNSAVNGSQTAAGPQPVLSHPATSAPPAGPTNFSGSNSTQIVGVVQKGSGGGLAASSVSHGAISGTITGPTNTAVYGLASNTSAGSNAAGVTGVSNTQNGPGVQGVTSSPTGFGVQGVASSATGGTAVQGLNNATTGYSVGVAGQTSSTTQNSSGVNGFEAATTGQVYGVSGGTNSTTQGSSGVNGFEGATTGYVFGVFGGTGSTTNFSAGVSGDESATSGQVYGVVGVSNSSTAGAAAVNGYEPSKTGAVYGVSGGAVSTTNFAAGVSGFEGAATGEVFGVTGSTNSSTSGSSGLNGSEGATSGGPVYGVSGYASSTSGIGVFGQANATSGFAVGVEGLTQSSGGTAGQFVNTSGSGLVLVGQSGSTFATVFSVDAAGNVSIKGKLTKGSGSFKIDDPLDPANKYLSHSFVESPDMMNVYNGNITTDKRGLATIILPDYFEALNRDFRYQLTVIGQFAQAIVKREIANNRFTIKTNKPSVRVSWQVTGIRHDAYANSNRIAVEEEKPPQERGRYLHPELFGASEQQAVGVVAPAPASSEDSSEGGSRR